MIVTHHSSEERRQVETTCSAPIALLAPEVSLGVAVKRLRTAGSVGALVLKSHCSLFFSSWFPHGLCSSSSCLFPQHVPWSESYLPNRYAGHMCWVAKVLCPCGWGRMSSGWILRRVVIELGFGVEMIYWFIKLGFLISTIKA